MALLRDTQQSPAPVPWVGTAPNHALPLQTFQDAGEGARIDVEELSEIAGGYAGEASDQAEGQALWPRDPQRRLHSLGGLLERVVQGPDQPHELEDFSQVRRTGDADQR
jgi:hypothetical protein